MRPGSISQHGFTLMEMLVVLIIVGIMAGLATPFMNTQLATQRINGDYRSIRDAMRLAKSGGSTNKDFSSVVVCPGDQTSGCTGAAWEKGFIAFGDVDANGSYGSKDVILAVQEKLSDGTTLKVTDENSGSAAVSTIKLTEQGYTADFNSKTAPSYLFKYCSTRTKLKTVVKGLVYGPGGVIRMAVDTDGDGVVNYGVSNLSCP